LEQENVVLAILDDQNQRLVNHIRRITVKY
jgi:hypothetical protein